MIKTKRILKYILLLLILFILLISGVYAYKNYYSSSNSQYDPKQKISFVSVGDSLTQGVGDNTNSGGYVNRIKDKFVNDKNAKLNVYNYGIAGQRTDQIDKRIINNTNGLLTHIKHSNAVILTSGGNDLLQALQKNALINDKDEFNKNMTVNLVNYKDNLSSLIKHIRNINKKIPIYIFSIYNPVYVYFPKVHAIENYVSKYNDIIDNESSNQKWIHFVNINSLSYGQYRTERQKNKLLESSDDSFNPLSLDDLYSNEKELNEYLSSKDHFHPNSKGYDFMTNKLFKIMEKYNDWY
ncbi:GDSL-type esterase/lipase family protein [Apilactobacillus timberlakei]|uniref:GDSL-type esterase/lipase family protein n=1 Tax=Apilactobacillus timberlakei TaxID=2008380 RepID=UPI001CDD192E|nr:GDSL-type esterase/lipase family protein [Apilactobacillus timberlakei]